MQTSGLERARSINGMLPREGCMRRSYGTLTEPSSVSALKKTDPLISRKVDIGFAVPKLSKKLQQSWMAEHRVIRANPEMEKQARYKLLSVDLNQVKDIWTKTVRPLHLHKIAEHYGVFQHLFGYAYFKPVVPLEVDYRIEDDTFVRVFTGNVIKPNEARQHPIVNYETKTDTLWTLIMSTPDGNLQNSNNEYCHWFLGNIPGNKVEHGEQIVDYLKPIPSRGIGYYRYIFVLYKQNQPLDYTKYKKTQPCLDLKERDWNTLEFYREHQENLTPAGLAFFQSDWDPTVTEFYHSSLDAEEPIFQYNFPKPYVRSQEWFPLKQPFNLYLDYYRDPKETMKYFLLRKLKNVHPFREPKPPLKYPNACPIDDSVPSWLKTQIKRERLGFGRINDMK
ncbi:mitochondrial ribosomal protein L38 isoform X2 [Nomia melanderi]|uniref:mitochondrial ribosomal protein L38 isoform X2 n=1 Tax=Nomia melanderi TaxID=2448451 RepID=UPI00130456C4|nr:39S ribosomal protein L38, mitochondrial isoform X2 [Nomia melanderi]XP_031828086.1 39S ribosomal protein L38, mitochondrial isoform X2 [Nomia melanderi]